MAQGQGESYNDKLFKEILPYFSRSMPTMELRDCPCISDKLTTEEMQKVGKKCELEGNNAGARLLLEFLRRHDHWFQAIVDATNIKDLKIEMCKFQFEKIKAEVDKEWQEKHPLDPSIRVCNPSVSSLPPPPTQVTTMESDTSTARAPAPVSVGDISDDFKLLVTCAGLQRDTAVEMEDMDAPLEALPQTAPPPPPQPPAQEKEDKEKGEQAAQLEPEAAAAAAGEEEEEEEGQYTEAMSTAVDDTYQRLQPEDKNEDQYTQLTDVCLEKDAVPMPEQPSEEGAVPEAGPQGPSPQRASHRRRQPPRTRAEHPSLREAISSDPLRDFAERCVQQSLDTLPGWSHHQEEHKVIQLIRPHRSTEGYFVIWFWKLAKRPTICVAREGRVITFVVHKSATRNRFYINRQQRTSESLRELVEFHLQHGVQYTPQGEQETLVQLRHPHARQ